jgi:carbohydrate kinase (thermoresistant glucokinase family)
VEAGRRSVTVEFARPPVLVLMGVTGSGKSTIGGILAGRLGWDLGEGDDLHPPENVAKMAAGHPLTDADRWPWLQRVRSWIDEHVAVGRAGVITCSALKRSYRDVLRDPHVVFVHLHGTREQLAARLATRHGHFMPAALLQSQLADLEPPGEDEQALTIEIGPSASVQAAAIVDKLALE